MSMWSAIALIAIAAIAGEAYRHHVRNRPPGTGPDGVEELRRRLDELESDLGQRVETLERIVTDRQEELKRQFDRLDGNG